jgi:acyl-CoA hydrolase
MIRFDRIEKAADWIDQTFGNDLSLAAPLGLGKPNQLINTIYTRIKNNPKRSLKLFTALSLQIPNPKTDLEKRFIVPFSERHFGKDYPELLYSVDFANHALPAHIEIYEFYCQAGTVLGNPRMQRNYMSVNYTHVAEVVYAREIPVLLCLIAKHPTDPKKYSLSCNPDLTLDLADVYQKKGKRMHMVGVVHPDLPYMTEDAEMDESFFSVIVDSTEVNHTLFALPREPITDSDYLIGLRASMLVPDDGTLQVGIGSLSDALIHSLLLRQNEPAVYKEITDQLIATQASNQNHLHEFHQAPFQKGLYGTSEMVMDAFMHLRKGNILKREILDSDDRVKRYLHGAFFLGSKPFYQWMRERFSENDHGLCMTKVSKVNDLYDPHELAIRRQRKNARFFNMCLEITLLGGIASDTLENGQVISGVGGQYNFVAMSHELPDSHSVLLFHSYHVKNGQKFSNINWSQGQLTIPRHLRDVFITEYGFAFTRGSTDEEVIMANLEITDLAYQEGLKVTAIKNGKLAKDFKLPAHCAKNTEKETSEFLKPYRKYFSSYPFGSDFTPVEEKLAAALNHIKDHLAFKTKIAKILWKGVFVSNQSFTEELKRMDLFTAKTLNQKIYQCILKGALSILSEA